MWRVISKEEEGGGIRVAAFFMSCAGLLEEGGGDHQVSLESKSNFHHAHGYH